MAKSKRAARKAPSRNPKKTNVVFLIVATLAVAGIAALVLYSYTGGGTEAADKAETLREVSRLAALNAAGQIQSSDLEQLKAMVEGDHAAEHEVEEIEKLISYGEGAHATHVFAFLASYLETGRESVCPGHALAHYYIFSRHGDVESAEHGLEDAKLQMHEWEEKAREFNERFPGEFPFDYVSDKVKSHILAIESGKTQTTDEEIEFLAEKTVCVDSDMEGTHADSEDEHV